MRRGTAALIVAWLLGCSQGGPQPTTETAGKPGYPHGEVRVMKTWRGPKSDAGRKGFWVEARLTNRGKTPIQDPKLICDGYAKQQPVAQGSSRWKGALRPGRYKTYQVWMPEGRTRIESVECYLTLY